ncbi:hypothetical protein BH18ACI4_BH18ACI4_08260 [soil metagenome]
MPGLPALVAPHGNREPWVGATPTQPQNVAKVGVVFPGFSDPKFFPGLPLCVFARQFSLLFVLASLRFGLQNRNQFFKLARQ